MSTLVPSEPANNPFQRAAWAISRHLPRGLKAQLSRAIVDLNGDYRKSIFLAGAGRAGTTWISNIINYDNTYRDMFEPFHSFFVRQSRPFYYQLYLRPANHDKAFCDPATQILRGRIRSWWIDQHNRRWLVDKRLIKEIRANLWLKWLKVNFPELPIILLLRHPCAVVDSRMVSEWPTRLPAFLAQRHLMEDHLEPFREAIISARTLFERHIIVWCIQYYVPLMQFSPGEIHLAFYENFMINPKEEIGRLFTFLGRKAESNVFAMLEKPSWTTRPDSAAKTSTRSSPIDSWRSRVGGDEITRAVEILKVFGLDSIYGADSIPNLSGAEALLRLKPA